jgi:putative hydrolase of the HAD superfamily
MIRMETHTDYTELIEKYCRTLTPLPTEVKARVRPLKHIRALICDIYGTLLVSSSGEIGTGDPLTRVSVLRDLLGEAGIVAADEHAEYLDGDPLALEIGAAHRSSKLQGEEYPEVEILNVWNTVLDKLGVTHDRAFVEKLALAYELRTNPVWPMPDAGEVLLQLERNNILLGIVSNAQFYTQPIFEGLLHRNLSQMGFKPDLTVFSYRKLCAKPSPRLFKSLLLPLKNHYGLDPSEVLYIGNDMLNDMLPARECGYRTAFFAGDARSLRLRDDIPACAKLTPDVTLTDLKQLLKVIVPKM